jgi:hypothetical protein
MNVSLSPPCLIFIPQTSLGNSYPKKEKKIMSHLIANYFNGSFTLAKKQAKQFKASQIVEYMESLAFSKEEILEVIKKLK